MIHIYIYSDSRLAALASSFSANLRLFAMSSTICHRKGKNKKTVILQIIRNILVPLQPKI